MTALDLSKLPAPNVVEPLSHDQLVADAVTWLTENDQPVTNLTPSDPGYRVMLGTTYRELLCRQRINESAKALMLAFATEADLDQLAANVELERLVLDAGNPLAKPPVQPVYESDDSLRLRIQMRFEGFTTAGSVKAYLFHTRSADARVQDASVVTPSLEEAGTVRIFVLSSEGDGTPSQAVLDAVVNRLNAEDVRPLTDKVIVAAADIISYAIDADLVMLPGPDAGLVREAAIEAATKYANDQRQLGLGASLSGVYAALHRPGVAKVILRQPTADIPCSVTQAAYCTSIAVNMVAE